MNRGIIEAAVTGKTLRLELEYRWPARVPDGMATIEEGTASSGLVGPYAITKFRSSLFVAECV